MAGLYNLPTRRKKTSQDQDKINPRSHGYGLQKQGKSTDYFNVLKLED